ncbi:uncharacterized protein F5Z01DRAFT_626998 [Emericellopsis atlantica]|uniref:AMP-activated protein kinase glycogen-binding domain-containing protein n=1 Tax=Emericellopsis atlantica TaxID=2614577 RepID=A0A9P8CM56_9HYPO|nr:uncharacterized protein F5Z01DRAFT_626998 [Emericellopsis atlantica]KAG9251742.1 hypothetical protein F5Z01DRAFT_626998 [Emericellopsis atlantica]
MGSYTFKWEHPAEEVYVTGTFDDWTKSVKLEKEGDVFQKTVDLKDASKKIYYKFVVDNNWVLNESAPKEPDQEGNINNFLTPEQIATPSASAAVINTVTPTSTTTAMAGEVPKEGAATPSDVPGGFPETPANELDKPIGVAPLPAADGAVNPIAPASTIVPVPATQDEINKNVKLDKESYEKADTLPGTANAASIDTAKPVIPESGLPVTDNTVSSVGPTATTVGLAGAVPKEPKGKETDTEVPEAVKESQQKAGQSPEASAVAEEVREKAEVEHELMAKVPEAPVTSQGTAGVGTEKSENSTGIAAGAAAAVTAAGATVAAAAISAKDTAVEKGGPVANQTAASAADAANKNLPDSVKEKLPVSVQDAIKTEDKEVTREEVSPEVPTEVKQSITEAHESPEAAANTTAVAEKKEVETELLQEVKPAPALAETKGDEVKSDPAPAKPVTDAGAAAEPLKPQEEKKVEADKPTETATKPTESKPVETKTDAAAAGKSTTPANGSGSASATKPAETASTTEKKKKNRLSAMLSKIKHKMSDK